MKTSPRPKSRPMSKSPRPMPRPGQKPMAKSLRPKTRDDFEVEQDVKAAGKGYAKGGCVMAGRGGKYKGSK